MAIERNRSIDHANCYPEPGVSIAGADGEPPTTLAGCYPALGHYAVDVNIYAASASTGSFNVYAWDDAMEKLLLLLNQTFNTAANCKYRVEIAGLPFFIKHVSATVTCAYSYTLI